MLAENFSKESFLLLITGYIEAIRLLFKVI